MVRILLCALAGAVLAPGCGSDAVDGPADGAGSPVPSGRIAYTCGHPPAICLVETDGTGRTRLTDEGAVHQAPDWEPDGAGLVTSRIVRDRFVLNRVDVRTGAAERITPRGRQATYGRVSADGARLVFACPDDAWVMDICVSDADGSGSEALVTSPLNEFDPDWSPDGSRIVFARYPEASMAEVVLLDIEGGEERPLTEGLTPAWSPDGRTIALSGGGLWLFNLESGDERRLTDGQFDTEPSWSPDGGWIVFRRGELPDSALYLVHVESGAEQRLTPDGEQAALPSWSPAG